MDPHHAGPCDPPDLPTSDVVAYYAAYFRPGMIDLSSSSPPAAALEWPALDGAAPVDYVPPSGAPELREAIAGLYTGLDAGDILLAAGASEALVAVALATLRYGDLAAVDPGTYPSFLDAARHAGAILVRPECAPGGQLVRLASQPSVPDGARVDVEALARSTPPGTLLAVDEVYRHLALDGDMPPSVADVDASAVSIGGLSKPLGLGGLRIGWVASRDHDLLARLDRQLQLLSGGPAGPSVLLARAALAQFDACVNDTLCAARRAMPRMCAMLSTYGWTAQPPELGLTLSARPPRPVAPGALERLRARGLFLIPGEVFEAPGVFRIGLLSPPDALETALALLSPAG